MNRQERYRAEYKKLKPKWDDSQKLYADLIACKTSSDTKILDIGCGHSDLLQSIYSVTPHTYGIDPDQAGLEKNKFLTHTTVGMADNMPYEDNFFDLVISAWVLEHLDNPKEVFKEIHRVLKPGGSVVFLTPNSWNYVVCMNRSIPHIFHDYLTKKLYNRQEHDTFPVRYKINSTRSIRSLMRVIGFDEVHLLLNGDPTYISFNNVLFWLSCRIESLLDNRLFAGLKVHIIGMYRK